MNYPEELTNTYDIFEQIGMGGGGTVYRAVHRRLQKTVVLKRITSNYTNIQECRTEVDILKNLHHTYLPQVLDFIESLDGIFTVMDFIPGKSFRQMLDEGHKFTEREVLRYTKQICEALDYLHSQNPPIVHGDIKPDNIMVTPEGNVCLIDFNISGILEGKEAQAFGYTPGFSPPEQVEGFEMARARMVERSKVQITVPQKMESSRTMLISPDGHDKTILLSQEDRDRTILLTSVEGSTMFLNVEEPVATIYNSTARTGIIIDKRSDIFSLGATLYTLLTGKVLDVMALNVELPKVSDGFRIILEKALERNAAKRYQDAGKMLQAVLQVHKNNRIYKQLLRRQQVISGLIVLLIAFGAFLIAEGRRVMESEREGTYYALVEQMEEGGLSGMDAETFEEIYATATEMYPTYFEAYYEKAYFLFQTGDYEAAIQYISGVLNMSLETNDELRSNMYHLYGECYFRLEDYQSAVDCYQTSLSYRGDDSSVYRDYAISLVYLGRSGEASDVLEEALAAGMTEVDVYMVRGELARTAGDTEEALSYFRNVIDGAEDEYLLQRAYIMGSRTYADIGTAEALVQDTEWLTEGIAALVMNSRLLLYERLAQDYITLGEMTLENAYYNQAVGVFRQIWEMGWDTYMTYNNAIILCQRTGDLAQAEEWAVEMQERYPENYVTFVRLAFLEVEKQNQKENQKRNYADFEIYYRQAKEYYEQQVSGNVTDAEMQLLGNTMQQLVDGGWL